MNSALLVRNNMLSIHNVIEHMMYSKIRPWSHFYVYASVFTYFRTISYLPSSLSAFFCLLLGDGVGSGSEHSVSDVLWLWWSRTIFLFFNIWGTIIWEYWPFWQSVKSVNYVDFDNHSSTNIFHTYLVWDTVLGNDHTVVNKTKALPSWIFYWSRRRQITKTQSSRYVIHIRLC